MKINAAVLLSIISGAALGDTPAIYRCERDGVVVYSDRRCAEGAQPHQLDDSRVTVYEAPPVSERAASSDIKKARPKKARRRDTTSLELRQARCAKLSQSLRDVRTKMRTGYGVEEGERLKERHRQVTAERRSEKCS